jgi:hypothetical protein
MVLVAGKEPPSYPSGYSLLIYPSGYSLFIFTQQVTWKGPPTLINHTSRPILEDKIEFSP